MASGRQHSMQSRGARIAAGVAAAGALVALWLFFAPSQLGGATTYSITEGISMQPMLHKSDLALVRTQSSYKVGEVVLYNSSTLHRPVLHRIILIQNGHYFFKGDNNGFVDPGYATRGELVGKLWLHVQAVGAIVGWIGKPLHAALLAGSTMLLLLLGGMTGVRHSGRRRRGRGPVTASPPPLAPARRYLMPVSGPLLAVLGVLLLLGVVLAGVGFATPSSRWVQRENAYQQTGAFSYTAPLNKPSAVYPTGFAVTGQPLFAALFDTVAFGFRYRFVSGLTHRVHGTIGLKVLIMSPSSGWQHLRTIKATTSFGGDTAMVGGALVVKTLYRFLNELSAAAGTPGAQYSLELRPAVHVVGTVGGKAIDSTFSPVLPISVTPTVVRLDIVPTAAPLGATYAPQTGQDALSLALKPVQSGSIPRRAANLVTIARYQLPVLAMRVLGLIALGLAILLAIVHDWLLRRHSRRPIEEQIATHFGCLVTPVDALVLPAGSTPTPVHDFTSLAVLARYLERPILRQTDESGSTYAVDDETRAYQYRASPFGKRRLHAAPSTPVRKPADPAGRPPRLVIGGTLLALLIAITLVTSFTATTNVPASRAGVSSQTRQVSQLAPAACSSLGLTTVQFGSGNFSTTASHVLMIGTSGNNVISDYGGHNCIVGGGGWDVVSGAFSDVCIVGPGVLSSYLLCTKA